GAATPTGTACAAGSRCSRHERADRRDLHDLPRVRERAVPRRAGVDDRAHAAGCVRRRAGRCAAAPRRRRAPARLRPLHPRPSCRCRGARHRHAPRRGRPRVPLPPFRRGDRRADQDACRREALPLRDRPVVPAGALAGVAPLARSPGRSVRRRRGRRVRALAPRRRRGPPATLRRRRQGRRARDAGTRALSPCARGRTRPLVPTEALALALSAAVIHAVWNTLLAGARDPQVFAAVVLLVSAVVGAPAAVFFWHVHEAVWPFVLATSALELTYFILLD